MPSYDRRDPAKAYSQVMADIHRTIKTLEEKLRVHSRVAEEKPEDWGYVGDVSHVLKQLGDVVDFLTEESEVD
jgi:hypothetical protein